jgi:hypothetical protein
MAHPTSRDDTGDGIDEQPDRGATYRTPRWVKTFGIALLVLLLLVIVMLASGHSARRHFPGISHAGVAGQVQAISVPEAMAGQP